MIFQLFPISSISLENIVLSIDRNPRSQNFSQYRRVSSIEPPISSIVDTEKLWFFCLSFADNSENWLEIPKKRDNFWGQNIISYREKKTNIVSILYKKKRIAQGCPLLISIFSTCFVLTAVRRDPTASSALDWTSEACFSGSDTFYHITL